jgi:UDP-2,3-diacylglucosamine pyrophosphatase LpxH
MKVALLTDTHYCFKKSSRFFHDYFELFYKNIFFPTLEKEGITTVIHLGDAFDNRKGVDYWGLDWTKRVVLEPLSKYEVHMIVGNHDIFLRNSTQINAQELLLKEYPNIKTYSSPQTVNIGGLDIMMIPWICEENQNKTFEEIKKTKAKVAMGHLELQGFAVNKTMVMEDHGLKPDIFDKFKRVYSGHFHTRSTNGTIYYLGNTYQMFWSDVKDERGFHIFDTETLKHTPINNPYELFHIIYYEDNNYQMLDASRYENKIVKIIVRKKSKPKDFEKYIDKLYSAGVQELKIVENHIIEEIEDFEGLEEENTLSILNRYIDESEVSYDKTTIKNILQEIYKEACEVD